MRKQTGFTLIEILVTVVISAIGLLGLAGLQAAALSYNSTAYQRSQATNLAYDIIDRARANAAAARNGDYNVSFGFSNQGTGTLAQQDLSEWRQSLINSLPAGTAEVFWDNVNRVFRVIVQWDDSRGQEALRAFQTETEL